MSIFFTAAASPNSRVLAERTRPEIQMGHAWEGAEDTQVHSGKSVAEAHYNLLAGINFHAVRLNTPGMTGSSQDRKPRGQYT